MVITYNISHCILYIIYLTKTYLLSFFNNPKNIKKILHLDFFPKILLNITMTEKINEKVINIFSKHLSDKPSEHEERVKFFAGFNYVKIKKDGNGQKFNAEKLKKYATKCHYIVRVMRNLGEDAVLYNYDVPNDKLFKFIQAFENNTLNGTIIEIDKYFPEDLA